jgi:uncharacterized protein with GYD domain
LRGSRIDRTKEGLLMPRFLFEASYTFEGVKGVQREGGSSRRDAVAKAVESVGGRLESFYFAFGDRDAYVIADLPDNESATAVSLAVNASGALTARTRVLLSPEEVDAAGKRSVGYRPPTADEPLHFPGAAATRR